MATSTKAPTHNGSRMAVLRIRKGWTQRQLADVSGYSLSLVKKLEQGQRSLDQASMILLFARVLDCHPAAITGHPILSDRPDLDSGHATVAGVRQELLRYDQTPVLTDEAVTAVSLSRLRQRVSEINQLRLAASITQMGTTVPGLLADLRVAAHVLDGTARETVYALMVDAYAAAMMVFYKLGYASDSIIATERVRWSAARSGDRLQVLAGEWHMAGEHLAVGNYRDADGMVDRALGELDPLVGQDDRALSLSGMFHLRRGLIAARKFDAAGTWEGWQAAHKLAVRLGADHNHFQLCFGPTNVALWGVSLPVELGRGREAVKRAEPVAATLPPNYSTERRSHFHIDLGRAYFYAGQRDAAHHAFLTAESLAPQQTRNHAGVQETTRMLIAQRARSGDLIEFGLRMGVV